jgi:hypothetical protein
VLSRQHRQHLLHLWVPCLATPAASADRCCLQPGREQRDDCPRRASTMCESQALQRPLRIIFHGACGVYSHAPQVYTYKNLSLARTHRAEKPHASEETQLARRTTE